jgi:hypothetical protein
MPNYSSSFTKYRAYNITPDTLSAIVGTVAKFTEAAVTTTIYLDDDHEVKGDDLGALVNDTFVKAQKIRRIKIDSRSKLSQDIDHSISIGFEADLLRVVQVTISGDRDRSIVARRELESVLHGAEYWYSPLLPPRSLIFFQLSFFVPILLIAALSVYLTWLFGGAVTENSITGWAGLVFVVLLAGYFGLKDYIFPRLTFDIGRSAGRIKVAHYWRTTLFTSVVVGIVIKLVVDRLIK